jgi:hypothetical protein
MHEVVKVTNKHQAKIVFRLMNKEMKVPNMKTQKEYFFQRVDDLIEHNEPIYMDADYDGTFGWASSLMEGEKPISFLSFLGNFRVNNTYKNFKFTNKEQIEMMLQIGEASGKPGILSTASPRSKGRKGYTSYWGDEFFYSYGDTHATVEPFKEYYKLLSFTGKTNSGE